VPRRCCSNSHLLLTVNNRPGANGWRASVINVSGRDRELWLTR
jgi:hypothetical protein